MLKLRTKTKLAPEQVIIRAEGFFGPGGYGLKATDHGDECVTFEGGGGEVRIAACREEEMTTVDMDARE